MRLIVAAVLALAVLTSSVGAQRAPAAGPTAAYVCGLLTKTQVEKEIGRDLYGEGNGMPLGGGAICDWDGGEAQVMLFTGPRSEANWEGVLKRFRYENTKRTPVPGFGAPAYVIYPPPKSEYQETVAMVVVKTSQGTVVVSSAAKNGPAEKALGPTVALTKLVLAKLK